MSTGVMVKPGVEWDCWNFERFLTSRQSKQETCNKKIITVVFNYSDPSKLLVRFIGIPVETRTFNALKLASQTSFKGVTIIVRVLLSL